MKSLKHYLKEDNKSVRIIISLLDDKIKQAKKNKKLSEDKINIITDFRENYLNILDDYDLFDKEEIPFDYEKLILEKIAEIIKRLE